MEPAIKPHDAEFYERGTSTCYQCGHEWKSIILNGATIVCLGCGTVSQVAIKYTPAGSLKESRRRAKEERQLLKLQSARRNAMLRMREKRVAVVFMLVGLIICIPTFFFELGDYAWPAFCAGTCCFLVGLLSLSYLRYLQF